MNQVHAPSVATNIVIVGGGAAGIAVAASLRARRQSLRITIIEPSESHYYQPGWTLVGGGVMAQNVTQRATASLIPPSVDWRRAAVTGFEPAQNSVLLDDGSTVPYDMLIVAPGIKLDWAAIDGLPETLGQNGVTSNYRFDLAPYTWALVEGLKRGKAIFTQPPMPIKCAGAPQKALYLSCDEWFRNGVLKDIEVEFDNAGAVLFGVEAFVPALMEYIRKYDAALCFSSNLRAVDGPGKKAWFDVADEKGETRRVEKSFDMIHICPPQTAPDFVRDSPIADAAGWVEVDQETLQHTRFANIFGLGDACSAPNAKTAAAVRKQAPVVAENVLAVIDGKTPDAIYDGYGGCPLTVERGKIVLAEFSYGGKLAPTFPFLDPTKPSRLAWFLKEKLLPPVYWNVMLKGREWLVKPDHRQTLGQQPGQ